MSKVKNLKLGVVLIALFTSFSVSAQDSIPVNEETGRAEYKIPKAVPGVSAEELHNRAVTWVNNFYVNPNGVIQENDKEALTLVGRARFKLSRTEKRGHVNPNAGVVSYQISFEFKEGKYRYTIDGIRWEQPSYYDVSQWSDKSQTNYDAEVFTSYIQQTIKYFDDLRSNLEAYLAVGEVKKKDDW